MLNSFAADNLGKPEVIGSKIAVKRCRSFRDAKLTRFRTRRITGGLVI